MNILGFFFYLFICEEYNYYIYYNKILWIEMNFENVIPPLCFVKM